MKQGKLAESARLFRKAVGITERAHGPMGAPTRNVAIGLWNVLKLTGGCEAEMAQLDRRHGI